MCEKNIMKDGLHLTKLSQSGLLFWPTIYM